ncbi:MAG: translation initiation factor 2 [Butyrivibrio sp.]|uniref:translation initiation factor 2 n=1 Tax=Butyrivibrio sp. TaxID=28121 RepID=UPI001B4244C9|nr:translation initiation factor 2 [Butyrivibrio sp.]MBP3782624.1 translation initiation factor 2 [Butyrivibrio sp.]
MKGKHHITVESSNLKYEFEIKRNFTVILGESATGKTTLIDLLNEIRRRGGNGAVRIQSDVPCSVYLAGEDNWKYELAGLSGTIVFFDEDYRFIFTKEFAEFAAKADNYFVFITRKPLKNLPYSINEIYGIRTTGKYHFPEQAYHEFYPIYDNELCLNNIDAKLLLLVEDKDSGYEFYKSVAQKADVRSAEGNSSILPKMIESSLDGKMLVVADGAAFGAYIDAVIKFAEMKGNVGLYFPESFEWIILKSGVLGNNDIQSILDSPEEYIDSQKYVSWERFFTALLIERTKNDKYMRYSKTKLPEYYLTPGSVEKIRNVIPEEIRNLFL